MSLEDFITDSNKRKNWILEGSPDYASDCSSRDSSDETVAEKIELWLKGNSDSSYVKSRHIADDLDINASQIGLCLSQMDSVRRWNDSTNVFVNPYSDIGEMD